MFDVKDELFSKAIVQKIATFTAAEKAELAAKVRAKQQNHLKKELEIILKNESELRKQLQNSERYRYAEKACEYQPTFYQLTSGAVEKLKKCLHYIHCAAKHNDQPEFKKQCSICTVELVENCKMVILGCNHHFHSQCIEKWFLTKTNCPLCRDSLNKNNNRNQKFMRIESEIKELSICREAIISRNKFARKLMEQKLLNKIGSKLCKYS